MQMTMTEALDSTMPGAVDFGEGLVTFELYAPNKRRVELISVPIGQEIVTHDMEDRGGGLWAMAMNLPPGKCEYRFRLDDEIVIADPYAQEIRREVGDPTPWAVVDVGRPVYFWKNEGWRRPAMREMIIYELHVGDFTPEGTFTGALNRLDYLKERGINAIEFMPLYERSEDDYWGYMPAYFLAVRNSFGTIMELIELVDECHARDIAVILDLVLAHTGKDHPFFAMYPYDESPWYGAGLGEPNQFGLPMLDFTKGPTNSFVRDVQAYWMNVVHVDGFRYDYLAGIGAGGDKGLPYLMKTARDIRPEAYAIGECIPEDPDLVNNSGLDGVWHTRSRLALRALLCETQVNPYDWNDFETCIRAFDPSTQGYAQPSFMVNYLECHDDERIIRLLRDAGFDDTATGLKAGLAATVLMTMPGEPMIYHGQEFGEETAKSPGPNPLQWDKLRSELGGGLASHYARMCKLRRSRVSLRERNISFPVIDSHAKVAVVNRWWGQADQVVVVLNFSNHLQVIDVPMPQGGRWHELFTGQIMQIKYSVETELSPFSAGIYIIGVS